MQEALGFVFQAWEAFGGYIKRKITLVTKYKKNLEDMEEEASKLKAKREDVHVAVKEAEDRLEEPLNVVTTWLGTVAKMDEKVEIIKEQAKNENRFLWGFLPDWGFRYKLSKKALKMAEEVRQQREAGDFSKVAKPPAVPKMVPMFTDYMEGIGTMEAVKKQVIDALEDETVTMIGLHGMGGSGKTTLMQRVNNELREAALFERIIMVTVPNISEPTRSIKVQEAIAARLGLLDQLVADAELYTRAHRLSRRLKAEGSIVIILDDVWEKLSLSDAGIPVNSSETKIVVTTREESVCRGMGVQRIIKMKNLRKDEAWELFRARSGANVDLEEIEPVARQVCEECGGLPLALNVVGKTLTGVREEYVWSNSLRVLRSPNPTELEGYEEQVINSLRLSYERLPNKNYKLGFLFCCLFPEDYTVTAHDIIRYGLGEGFLNSKGGASGLWNASLVLIKRLKDSGLMLEVTSDGYELDRREWSGRLHDVVRDVAIFVASKEGDYMFLSEAGVGLQDWPEWDKVKDRRRISLMHNRMGATLLPDALEGCRSSCRTLMLQNNPTLLEISDDFFSGMEDSLVVLDLSATGISLLPNSLFGLSHLRSLHMNFCYGLNGIDVSEVEQLALLRGLRVLSMRGMKMRELPESFVALRHLKILDLSFTKIEIIPSGVIAEMSNLEQLHMLGSFDEWEEEDGENEEFATFYELTRLKRLSSLQVSVKNVGVFSEEVVASSIWENLTSVVIWADQEMDVRCMKCQNVME